MNTFNDQGIIENTDSTNKQAIYQAAFNQSDLLASVLEQLEQRFSAKVMVDLEINSLEDAYINIAKEEERLFKDLAEHGVRRFSQVEQQNNNINSSMMETSALNTSARTDVNQEEKDPQAERDL